MTKASYLPPHVESNLFVGGSKMICASVASDFNDFSGESGSFEEYGEE